MVDSQLLVVKLMVWLRLWKYLGATVIDYRNEAILVWNQLVIKNRLAYFTSIGQIIIHLEIA